MIFLHLILRKKNEIAPKTERRSAKCVFIYGSPVNLFMDVLTLQDGIYIDGKSSDVLRNVSLFVEVLSTYLCMSLLILFL